MLFDQVATQLAEKQKSFQTAPLTMLSSCSFKCLVCFFFSAVTLTVNPRYSNLADLFVKFD